MISAPRAPGLEESQQNGGWNMKIFARALISSILICFAYVGTALGVQVRIDPADYTGQWTVDYGPVQRGVVVVDLDERDATTGFHVVSIGGAELFFNVAVNGTVTVKDRFAAEGGSHTLTFNTTTIMVNPVFFLGNWRVSDGATPDLSGVKFVMLVPGLRYYTLEVGATGGFFFDIAGDGTVTVQNDIAASGGQARTHGRRHGILELKDTSRFRRRRAAGDLDAAEDAAEDPEFRNLTNNQRGEARGSRR